MIFSKRNCITNELEAIYDNIPESMRLSRDMVKCNWHRKVKDLDVLEFRKTKRSS